MFGEHYYHELYVTDDHQAYMLDVSQGWGVNGYEAAYARFDAKTFEKHWFADEEEDIFVLYTLDDIKNYGEEFGAFDIWIPIATGKNPDSLIKKLQRYVNSL